MEEKNLKAIFAKTDQDYSRFFEFIKYNYKEEHFSNRNTFGFSILSAGLFTYKYLNNRIIYRENNGHFNSPQNLLNRKLSHNYMMEGTFRFILGSLIIFTGISLFKLYYLKLEEPLFSFDSEAEKRIQMKKDIEDIILINNKMDSSNGERIIKIGIDESEKMSEKYGANKFAIDQNLSFRNNINKYFEQYKKNDK